MTAIEILLLIAGGIIFIVSFLLPQKEHIEPQEAALSREQIKELLSDELKEAKTNMQDMVDETVTYSVEKAERAMERITNEKISAVSEFSDTVLTDINKNRDEVMFLYDMLNDKHENLKEAAREINLTTKEAKRVSEDLGKILEQKATGQDAQHMSEEPETPLDAENGTGTAEPVRTGQERLRDAFVPFGALEVERISPEDIAARKPAAKKTKTVKKVPEKAADVQAQPVKQPRQRAKRKTAYSENKLTEVPAAEFDGNVVSQSNNNEKILQLHRMNKSNVTIAKELGLGVGEVKLVIDLYKGM
ncbi:MAG: hypothetical protein IJ711_00610 [Lachnospiraceae bacterium]|nr:hypothetical protein [Lachnospiraceae bacterium]